LIVWAALDEEACVFAERRGLAGTFAVAMF
jgi:hypothetical protein